MENSFHKYSSSPFAVLNDAQTQWLAIEPDSQKMFASSCASFSSRQLAFLINFNHLSTLFLSFSLARYKFHKTFIALKSFKLRTPSKKRFRFYWIYSIDETAKAKSSLMSLGIERRLWSRQRVFKEACRCLHSSRSHKNELSTRGMKTISSAQSAALDKANEHQLC